MSAVLDQPNQSLSRSNASGSARASSIMPGPGEDYRSFVYRAHYALMPTIPDSDQRNQAVWNAWERVNGNPLRDHATDYFPPEQYRHVPNVCYFMEHSTTSRDGTPLNYGFNELCDIMDESNARTDTNAYSAICSHHTGVMKGPKHEPETLGFAGPYSLGMVGRVNPKWAIFADEHHSLNHLDTFNARRRRSVEVLRFADGRRSYFDPIATLGSDSPRLPLPVNRYEARQGDELIGVERYSVVSPVAVGASNTFIPGSNNRRDQYEMDDFAMTNPSGMNQGGMNQGSDSGSGSSGNSTGGMLTVEDVKAICQMIMSTPQMEWVREQMEKAPPAPGNGSVVPSSEPGAGSVDDLSMGHQAPANPANPMGPAGPAASGHPFPGGHPGQQAQPSHSPAPSHPASPTHSSNPAGQPIQHPTHQPSPSQVRNPNPYQQYSAKDGKMSAQNGQQATNQVTVEQYSALVNDHQALTEQYSALNDQYSALNQAHQQLFVQYGELKASVAEIQKRAVDAERSQAIKELYSQYPHFVVPEEEFAKCLYSQGSTMDEATFQGHIADLAKYAQRSSPVSTMIPGGTFDLPATVDKYAAEVAAKVVDRYTREMEKGIHRSYETIEAEIRKEMGIGG
jgi:hypothetical protein